MDYREPLVVQAMKDVLTFWMDKGADGFRIDAVNHLFEDSAMRNEPLSGKTEDSNNNDYLSHIYTKDLVRSQPLALFSFLSLLKRLFSARDL